MAVKFLDVATYRGRNYKLLLYPDNRDHMAVLRRIKKKPEFKDSYIGIWHVIYDDDHKEIIKGQGKKHAHILLDFQNPIYWRSLVKQLDIDPRFCMPLCCDIDKQGRFYKKPGQNITRGFVYLVHANAPDKEQYTVYDLFGSADMLDRAHKAINDYCNHILPMRECAFYIVDWIDEQDHYIKIIDFMRWVCSSPYFKAVSNPMVRAVLDEHNRIEMQKAEKRAKVFRDAERRDNVRSGLIVPSGSACLKYDLAEFEDILSCDEHLIF